MNAIEYRPEIDGLRAVAIVPVILFHLGAGWLPGGYLGVDVFFVISGFLITSILLREMTAGQFSFKRFWARRVRRIMPALLLVTAATLGAAWILVFPPDRPAIGRQAAATLVSVANFYFWRFASDYWGPQAEDSPFLHAWSLAVEEQFYVFFPVLLSLLVRWFPRRIVVGLLAILAVSLCLFIYGVQARPSATFYLLPTRAWELATGAVLAAVIHGRKGSVVALPGAAILAGAGLVATVASYFVVPVLSVWAVVPVIGAALVIWCGQNGLTKALLSLPALVYVGKISYSLYLWHWPVIVLSRHLGYDVPASVLMAIMTALAVASYHLVEEPFRRGTNVLPQIAAGFGSILIAASVVALVTPPLCDVSGFRQQTYSAYFNIHPHYDKPADRAEVLKALHATESVTAASAYIGDGIVIGSEDGPPRVVVLGDSHGCVWAHAISAACEEADLKVALYCMAGVRPFFSVPPLREQHCHRLTSDEKYQYDLTRIRRIEMWKPDVVFVCARWAIVQPGDADGLLTYLQTHARRVVLVEQPPELAGVGRNYVAEVAAFRCIRPVANTTQYWPQGNAGQFDAGRRLIRSLTARFPKCEVLPTVDLLLQNGRVWFLDGDKLLYKDDNHLTTDGTSLAASRIRDLLSR